jgi:hypothetical protein
VGTLRMGNGNGPGADVKRYHPYIKLIIENISYVQYSEDDAGFRVVV